MTIYVRCTPYTELVTQSHAGWTFRLWEALKPHVAYVERKAARHMHHVWLLLQVKEIIYPLGATIDIRQVALGDQTMSVLEIWGAEYQENDCLLIKPDDRPLLEAIAARERCIMQVSSTTEFDPVEQ